MNRSLSIVFFGDSITELGVKPNGYISILKDSLARRSSHIKVFGAGVSGNKISDLLARVDNDVITKKPNLVVVYIGINDVWHYAFASRGLSGTPKPAFREGLITLIHKLQENNIHVILCTPSVIGEKNDGTNTYDAMLDEYADVSREVAKQTKILLCDLRNAFKIYLKQNNPTNQEKNILTYDGVHLNDVGNFLVAQNILAVLNNYAGIGR